MQVVVALPRDLYPEIDGKISDWSSTSELIQDRVDGLHISSVHMIRCLVLGR